MFIEPLTGLATIVANKLIIINAFVVSIDNVSWGRDTLVEGVEPVEGF